MADGLRKAAARRAPGRPERASARGYADGWEDGYWLGACRAVALAAERPVVRRELHVLLVRSAKGYPYAPLDNAVAAALAATTARLSVTDALADVAGEALRLRPDLVLVFEGMNLPSEQVDAMRNAGIRTAVWLTDDPYYTDIMAPLAVHYDDVFTLERSCVPFYEGVGCARVHHLPLGVHPAIYTPRNVPRGQRHEICFVGSAYWNRVAFFSPLTELLAKRKSLLSGWWWDRLPDYRRLAHRIEAGVWHTPEETAVIYSGSKISINLHRAPDDDSYNHNSAGIGAVSPNPRTFEIAASGTLQMTDIRSDLALYYEPDREIVTFGSPGELAEKASFYLRHEEARRRIVLSALRRTIRDHTYERRLEEMLGLLFG